MLLLRFLNKPGGSAMEPTAVVSVMLPIDISCTAETVLDKPIMHIDFNNNLAII